MAETETYHVRPPEPITITIAKTRNLRGYRGDMLTVMVKVEFGEKCLGESPKIDYTAESPAEFNFSAVLNCTFDDPLVLDEIAHKPVVLTFIEVLPKEKRQKEEKTHNLGQCSLDLLPLIKGETTHKYTLVISTVPGSPLDFIPPEQPHPEVDVTVSVKEPLLDERQLQEGNLMTITVESLFSPPESWLLSGSQYFYCAALPIPIVAEKETTVVFPTGLLRPGVEKEVPSKQKKWAVPGTAVGNAIFIPDSEPIEEEDGDFKSKEDREHRHISETDKNRVVWNNERRRYLESSALKAYQDTIAKTRYWPVEIFRTPQPSSGVKGKKEDEGMVSFHGVAFLNLAPLLYPGVKRIRGAFKVLPFSDHLLQEKTKRKTGLGEEALKIALNQLHHGNISPSPKKGGKEKELDKKDVKKGRSNSVMQTQPPSEAEANVSQKMESLGDGESQNPVNVEGQQYADAKSYIMIDISLTRPLVPRRQPEELAKRVSELVPPRPLFPKRTDSADKAVEDYQGQIASVAALILEEFREQFGEDLKSGQSQSNEAMESRRQKLMYHLNSSGKYFAFKEQIKHSVIKIVREKYLRTTNFDDRQQLQTFLSELYVYLVDQMHQALNKVLQIEDQPPIPPPLTTSAQLKHFALEAEITQNFKMASKYYQERIIREENNADNWFDFGVFYLSVNNVPKAEECFHKCISINQKHMDGLLLYGVVCTLAERNDAAETFFESATNVDPKSVLAWTMLGLFYDFTGNDIRAEMAYTEASKLNFSLARAEHEEKEREKEKLREKERGEFDGESTDMLLSESDAAKDKELNFLASEGGLSIPTVEIKQPLSNSPASARSLNVREKRNSDKKVIVSGKNLAASRPTSQLHGSIRGTPLSEHEPVDLPPREPTPAPKISIYMQAVDWLLTVKAVPFTEQALAHELLTNSLGKTTAYHIAMARLKLQKNEYDEAAESLNEALEADHQDPDAWALLGHVNYLKGETTAACECYERTLSFVADASETHSIFLRLASIYLQEGQFEKAKNTFLMACKRSPSCVSWLGTGIACYRLGELGDAEDALMEANILNNTDAEVWGYLSLVCLRTGRKIEAEQSYKHAIKLNLQDEDLLKEIHELQKSVGFGNPEF